MPNTKIDLSVSARQPDDLSRILVQALETGDIETSVALYEPSAVLFSKSGRTMTGLDEIRKNNAALIALKPRFNIAFIKFTLSGDGSLATNRMKATLSWKDAEGKPVEASVDTLEVARKQEDGSWRYIIDDPYGSMRANLNER
ncbi:SnoaL-like domain protein [compost metagenome]